MTTAPTTSWPLFGLQVRTDEVAVRYPDDDDLLAALEVVAEDGIHATDEMPLAVPWTRYDRPTLQREALRFHWQCRAETRPGRFRIPLTVIAEGEIAGMSEVLADDYGVLGQVTTGSWLGRSWQGRGIGTATRRATLALAFEGLSAVRALTAAWDDNHASLAVTRKLGYSAQGSRWADREGAAVEMLGFEMDRERYEHIRPAVVEFRGLEGVREFLEIGT